jgi:hypothetical protein
MKIFAISSVLVLGSVGGVLAGDMRIDFPLFMRAPAPAAASAVAGGTATNLQVRLSSLSLSPSIKPRTDRNDQTFTGALGGAAADPVCPPFPTPLTFPERERNSVDEMGC